MKGFLLIFNTKDTKESIKLNYELVGRIVSVPNRGKTVRYYNSGELDKIPHKKLIRGCYFSTGDVNINDNRLLKMKVDLQSVFEKDLKTGRGHWKNHAKKNKFKVKNL